MMLEQDCYDLTGMYTTKESDERLEHEVGKLTAMMDKQMEIYQCEQKALQVGILCDTFK